MSRFYIENGCLVFEDNQPGNHATMFAGGRKLQFDGDASRFNDSERSYRWAFVIAGVKDGQRVVFATEDREATGEVAGNEIRLVDESIRVERDGGKPVRLVGVSGPRQESWFFTQASGVLRFHDNRPRSYVGMRGPHGQALTSRGDASSFSDAKHEYVWAFAFDGVFRDEDQVVFVAENFEAVGELRGEEIVLVEETRLAVPPTAPSRGTSKSGMRIMAIFPGVQSPGAGWATLSHASANNESAYMAHGMSYVSSYLKSRGHTVWLLDTRAFRSWKHFAEEVARQDYDYAMIGPLSIEAFTTACIVRILKEAHPRKPVIVGGLHVSMTKDKAFPPDDLPKFYFYQEPPTRMREYLSFKGESSYDPKRFTKADYLVWNEGELATAAIVEGDNLETGDWDFERTEYGTVFMNGKIVPDLNMMPHMDRSLFNEDMEKQHPLLPELPTPFHTITFGRGCPYKCAYCSVGEQFASTKVRLIDPDYFMEELHALKRANGGHIGSMMVHDDILLFPKWLWEWNEKIKQQFGHIVYWCQLRADFVVRNPDLMRHMAEAGMTWASVGFESGSAHMLQGTLNKELKVIGMDDPVEINIRAAEILTANGTNLFGNFLLGSPGETNEDMDATVRMIQRIQPQHQGFSTYADFPGTAMSRMVTDMGLRTSDWYARSHYPWQYRLKGVDYDHVRKCYEIAAQTPRKYVNPSTKGLWKA